MYSTTATIAGKELMRRTHDSPELVDSTHAEVYKAINAMEKGIKAQYTMGKGDSVEVQIVTRQHILDSEVVIKRDVVIFV